MHIMHLSVKSKLKDQRTRLNFAKSSRSNKESPRLLLAQEEASIQ